MKRGPLILVWCGTAGVFAAAHACTYDWPLPEETATGGTDGSTGGGSGTGGAAGSGAVGGGSGGSAGAGSGGVAGSGTGGSNVGVTPSGLEVTAGSNAVAELAEPATVKPSWTLTSAPTLAETGTLAVDGSASQATLVEDSATYSLIQSTSVACSSCYTVTPKARPTGLTHWDLSLDETLGTSGAQHTWLVHVGGSFSDVSTSATGYLEIETLLHLGYDTVIDYCAQSGAFCPGSSVRRDELAVWVAIALEGKASVPTSGSIGGVSYDCTTGPSYFSDVPTSNPACAHIHYLASLGIAGGTTAVDAGPPTFSPATTANRGAVAAFAAKALAIGKLKTQLPDNCSSGAGPFSDVPLSSQFCQVVAYLSSELGSATVSCATDQFCPTDPATRATSALWLVRMLDVPLYGL